MQRLLTLVLLALFGLPVVAPALALTQDPTQNLPACCRRNGAHHCAMKRVDPQRTAISARCSSLPQPQSVAPHATNTAILTTPSITLKLRTALTSPRAAEAQYRISQERSRYKRGPPATLLA